MNRLYDDAAEHHLAGAATITDQAARTAMERLDASSFHDPRAWAVIQAAAEIGRTISDTEAVDRIDTRCDAIADRAQVHVAELRRWVTETPILWDQDGHMAARVLAAAAARRRAAELIAELEQLGLNVRWPQAAA